MILAIDVHYRTNEAYAVGFLFDWDNAHPAQVVSSTITGIKEYISGEFYKRELPCLMEIINKIDRSSFATIVVDGYVYTDNELSFGLGGRLWEALGGNIPVIGVAKTSFYKNKNTVKEVYRGESKKPLYVSAVGIDVDEAANRIKAMEGNFRIPTILKYLDTVTKEI